MADNDLTNTLGKEGGDDNVTLEAVYDIPVQISVILGSTSMQVSQLLKLGRGAVVELDRKVGEPIDIYVNNRLIAKGEVVVVEDRIGVDDDGNYQTGKDVISYETFNYR